MPSATPTASVIAAEPGRGRLAHRLPLALWLALVALLWHALGSMPARTDDGPRTLVGRPVPEWVLPRLDDPTLFASDRDLRGRVWLLNVWASWCAPCRQEHPLLMELARDGGGDGAVSVVGIAHRDERDAARDWLRQHGDPYTTSVLDAAGRVAAAVGLTGVPQTLLVDQDGIVRWQHTGVLTRELVDGQLRVELRGLAQRRQR